MTIKPKPMTLRERYDTLRSRIDDPDYNDEPLAIIQDALDQLDAMDRLVAAQLETEKKLASQLNEMAAALKDSRQYMLPIAPKTAREKRVIDNDKLLARYKGRDKGETND